VDEIILNRIFDKLDTIDGKVGDLCDRMTKTETKIEAHLEEGKRRQASREKRFYVINAIIGTAVTVYVTFREFAS